MAVDTVIKVEDLSKRFRLGITGDIGDLRETIANYFNRLTKKQEYVDETKELWALKDISFDVARGEVLGVIGKNGAGKSTLLKLLSRISEPSTGRITIEGRVASLLEVGTGFHPDLTGRENIFLNGAILGMAQAEIRANLDEIIAFSGIARFINTPVKRYSSGMYVRLAFAVAAHLKPEVMIIDEVLAVGDAEFQKKCLGKMHDISVGGRTVLFVSHNMAAVNSLCTRAIFLENGQMSFEGDTDMAIGKYLTSGVSAKHSHEWEAEGETQEAESEVYLHSVKIKDKNGTVRGEFMSKEDVYVEMDVEVKKPLKHLKIGFDVKNLSYGMLFRTMFNDKLNLLEDEEFPAGRYVMTARIPSGVLNTNVYYICPRISLHRQRLLLHKDYLIAFNVIFELPNATHMTTERKGIISPILEWDMEENGSMIIKNP